MKLAITGKGGVGKTTLTSLLAWVYSTEGNKVIAIDANPDANLATALGISADEARRITPIAELKDLIQERTGAKPGNFGTFFKLNPKVDDIPEQFSVRKDGIKLLVMGTVKKGGSGCLCPEGSLLKSLVSHLILSRSEAVIMDMDAGVENLGRGTAKGVNAFIIVVEPGQRSFQTARAIRDLAKDLGVKKCYIVGSKTHDEKERQFIIDNLTDFEVLGFINYHSEVAEADRLGKSVFETSPTAVAEVKEIKRKLEQIIPRK
ncbi:MAG: carbon monoxide dehydrogenase [Crenarchaeota archaeon]|nr:carbon monoxide dehydrogenase [Thermoproteota archaeon]